MSKTAKIRLITAIVLVILGLILFGAVMTANNWDFTRLNTVKYETNTHVVSQQFNGISMNTGTADIVFLPSEDAACQVICYEQNNVEHAVAVQDGILTIHQIDEREWFEHIGVSFGTPKITVYLPIAHYETLHIKESTGDILIPKEFTFGNMDISATTGDIKNEAEASGCIKIKTSTGDIRVANTTAGSFQLAVSTGMIRVESVLCEGDVKLDTGTGDVWMTDVLCRSVTSRGSTGDVYLNNVLAAGKVSLERSTGDVSFKKCDAAVLFVRTGTGDITGDLLSEKVFVAQTSTGRVDVPGTITGGNCELTANTGDIRVEISGIPQ